MIMEELKDWFTPYRMLLAGGGLISISVLLVMFLFFGKDQAEDQVVSEGSQTAYAKGTDFFEKTQTSASTQSQTPEPIASSWMVDIKGAVKEPMLYKVSEGERVYDVIERAGGLLENADRNRINFSLKVADEMVIYIPKRGEELPDHLTAGAVSSSDGVSASGGEKGGSIDVNRATKEELMTVSGIGEKKAQDIIDYRESNGPFQKIEDLTNVSGIGVKTLEKLREQLTV